MKRPGKAIEPARIRLVSGWSLVGDRQYDRSIPLFKEVIDRSPESFFAYIAYKGLTAAYELTGRHSDAYWAAQNVMRMNPNFSLKRELQLSPVRGGLFKTRIFDAYRAAGLK